MTTEINLHVPARLPESYCNDVHERLVLYKRLTARDGLDPEDDAEKLRVTPTS